MPNRLIEPIAVIVICLGALWVVGVAFWFGKMAAVAVLLTALVIAFAVAVVELVLALVGPRHSQPAEPTE